MRSFLPAVLIVGLAACSGGDASGAATETETSPEPDLATGGKSPPEDEAVGDAATGDVAQSSNDATAAPTVPARFRNLYALDRKACAEDYNYGKAFQNVTVQAKRVLFFETGGPITDVEVDGNNIAITLDERVGDNIASRTIYFALNGDGTARYRSGISEPVEDYVVCE